MPDEAIEARAERLAQAREHWHCPICREDGEQLPNREGRNYCWTHPSVVGDWACTDDHRTPAEQRAAVLAALADVWAWGLEGMEDIEDAAEIANIYDRIQRTEGPQ